MIELERKLSDLLPWWDFVAPGIVLNTDGSLQATLLLERPDLRHQPPHIKSAMMLNVNNTLRQLEPGSVFTSETQRDRMPMPTAHEDWSHPVAAQVDREERARLAREPLYESQHYVTLAYQPPSSMKTWAGAWLRSESRSSHVPAWKSFLPAFRGTFAHLTRLLGGIMVEVHPLDDTETYNFLDFCMNLRHRQLKLPRDVHYLASHLDDESWEPGETMLRGGRSIRVVTVMGFPGMSVALMLSKLDDLGVPYRWAQRWIPYEALQADHHAANVQKAHAFHQRAFHVRLLDRWFGGSDGQDDPMAMYGSNEAAEARIDLRAGDQVMGELTITVTVWGDSPTEAVARAGSVKALFALMGFTAEIETLNLLSAFMGSMPGVRQWNPKKPVLESINVSQLMAVDGVWSGFSWNEHWDCPPLYLGKTSHTHPYRVVPHAARNASAHLLGFGPNGSGKSGFLSRLRMACQGVPGLRDFGLDFKRDSRTTTLMLHGTFTDLGRDDFSLQPLRNIHQPEEFAWAQGFCEAWLQDLHEVITADVSAFVSGSLTRLSRVPPAQRTWSRFHEAMSEGVLPSGVNPLHKANERDKADLRNLQRKVMTAMKRLCGTALDGSTDFSLDRIHTFELETLFNYMTRARPMLRVVRHVIENALTGEPMLLWCDEWQALLDDHESEETFKLWLQRLRSKNAMLALFLHEPSVIFDHAVGRTLVNNCTNKVFFPNLLALSPKNLEIYELFDLTERHVHQLATFPPRSGYLWKSEGGTRFVEYLFEPWMLEVCRSGERWHHDVDRVLSASGLEQFPAAWADARGFPAYAAEIRAWLEARHVVAAD